MDLLEVTNEELYDRFSVYDEPLNHKSNIFHFVGRANTFNTNAPPLVCSHAGSCGKYFQAVCHTALLQQP
jgi:hypothetical protein